MGLIYVFTFTLNIAGWFIYVEVNKRASHAVNLEKY